MCSKRHLHIEPLWPPIACLLHPHHCLRLPSSLLLPPFFLQWSPPPLLLTITKNLTLILLPIISQCARFLLMVTLWFSLRKGNNLLFTCFGKCNLKVLISKLLMYCSASLTLVVSPCMHAVVVYIMHSCSGWLLCGVPPELHQNSCFLVSGFKVWLHQSIKSVKNLLELERFRIFGLNLYS